MDSIVDVLAVRRRPPYDYGDIDSAALVNCYDLSPATGPPYNTGYPAQRPPRRLVEQRYDWDAISRRFVALVEETAQTRQLLATPMAVEVSCDRP